jgi:hypothetical protein
VSGRIVHMCISVRRMLRWPKRQLKKLVTDDNGRYLDAEAAKEWLLDQLSEGRECLPLGEPCEGFDYKTGCPGHEAPAPTPEVSP